MSTITELRSVLFETLQSVKAGNMEIDRAKAISELSQTIINTAKAEIDYAKATGANVCSGFIEHQPAPRLVGQAPAVPSLASQMEAAGRKSA